MSIFLTQDIQPGVQNLNIADAQHIAASVAGLTATDVAQALTQLREGSSRFKVEDRAISGQFTLTSTDERVLLITPSGDVNLALAASLEVEGEAIFVAHRGDDSTITVQRSNGVDLGIFIRPGEVAFIVWDSEDSRWQTVFITGQEPKGVIFISQETFVVDARHNNNLIVKFHGSPATTDIQTSLPKGWNAVFHNPEGGAWTIGVNGGGTINSFSNLIIDPGESYHIFRGLSGTSFDAVRIASTHSVENRTTSARVLADESGNVTISAHGENRATFESTGRMKFLRSDGGVSFEDGSEFLSNIFEIQHPPFPLSIHSYPRTNTEIFLSWRGSFGAGNKQINVRLTAAANAITELIGSFAEGHQSATFNVTGQTWDALRQFDGSGFFWEVLIDNIVVYRERCVVNGNDSILPAASFLRPSIRFHYPSPSTTIYGLGHPVSFNLEFSVVEINPATSGVFPFPMGVVSQELTQFTGEITIFGFVENVIVHEGSGTGAIGDRVYMARNVLNAGGVDTHWTIDPVNSDFVFDSIELPSGNEPSPRLGHPVAYGVIRALSANPNQFTVLFDFRGKLL